MTNKNEVQRLVDEMKSARQMNAEDFLEYAEKWKMDVAHIFDVEGNSDQSLEVRNCQLINAFGEASTDVSIYAWNRPVVEEIIASLQGLMRHAL